MRGPHRYDDQHADEGCVCLFLRQKYGRLQGGGVPGRRGALITAGGLQGVQLDRTRALSHQHAGLVGRRAPVCAAGALHCP